MKISKEVKVGVLAVISFVILYFGFNFLRGSELFSSENEYYALYENVGGLTASNPVMLNGLSVGQVKEIRLLQERGNQLLVTVSVGKDIKLPKTTVASLGDGGLLGVKMINLLVVPGGALLRDKDTLRTASPKGLQALIQEQALPVLQSADSLILTLQGVARKFDSTGYAVNRLLKTANRTMTTVDGTVQTLEATVQENRVNLSTLLANTNKLTMSLVETEKEIKPLLGKANSIMDSLKLVRIQETVAIANQTLGQVKSLLTDLQSGKGTAGRLLKDEVFYGNINRTMVNMDRLLVDFRQSPKRYVHFSLFGRKDKKVLIDSLQKSDISEK